MAELAATIIIPTYNRPQQLQRVLEALAKQTYPGDCFEVVIVDDGSRESYENITGQHWPFPLRYIRQENQGEVIARNLGVSLAQSNLLIFLDDDIYAKPEYVSELIEEHQRYPEAILLGVLYPWLDAHPTLFQEVMAPWPEVVQSGEVSYIECGSGTMAVGLPVYHKTGGLRTLGPGGRNAWGGMDFAYRAALAGYKVRRCANAGAFHDDFALKDLETMRQRFYKISRMAVLHIQRFPELLPQIPMFRDKTPIQWRVDPLPLILRKLLRKAGSSKAALNGYTRLVSFFEKKYPSRWLLRRLYRWIVFGTIYQGFQDGRREFGEGQG